MGLLDWIFGGTKKKVEKKRWDWVSSRFQHGEQRVATTPAWILGGPEPMGGHVLLTTKTMYVAGTQPPLGTEERPHVMEVRIDSISRLMMSDNGILATVSPDRQGDDASLMLDLYPSPFSRQVVSELKDRWEQATGGEAQGNWSLWLSDDAPMVERSAVSWQRGPVS